MLEIIMKPDIYSFNTCEEFVQAFELTKDDLVLSNQFIYEPYFGKFNLPVHTVFQEQFGTGEPTDVMVEGIMAKAKEANCKRIIAIGGGTVMDIAKILAVSEKESLDDLYADTSAIKKRRELIAIPTTCGTGSEVTNIAIVNRTKVGTKVGLVSPNMYADKAILIPKLLENLPFYVFATSSIDALVHAVEGNLSPKATDFTKLFGYKAMEMIIKGYQHIVAHGEESRKPLMKEFLTASNFAGLSFGTAGCAAVHALSYPLGGTYHVAHGESNYAMFTGVLKNYYEIKQDGEIAEMMNFLANLLNCTPEQSFDELDNLLNHILPKKRLRDYGVKEEELPVFTKSVVKEQQRLLANNFVFLDEARIGKIFTELY